MDLTVLGVLEFNSIAVGIKALDAMVKAAAIRVVDTKTVCPGKYIVIITGELAAVDASLTAGKETGQGHLIDELFIPNLHKQIIPAIKGTAGCTSWGALGVIESFSVTASIEAGDIAAKEAEIQIPEIRLAMGIGGKSYVKLVGSIEAVEAAMRAGVEYIRGKGLLCQEIIIPKAHPDIKPFFCNIRPEGYEPWK
ncbi:hypothetical protein ES703_34459 [subsurface metagenome]